MNQAYNFLASWQLFPEKCTYESGDTPKSGQYQLEWIERDGTIRFSINWLTQLNEAYFTTYQLKPDGLLHSFERQDLAEQVRLFIADSSCLTIEFYVEGSVRLQVNHEILPNGFMKVIQRGYNEQKLPFVNIEVYHKQMRVLPYASSIGSVVVRPTREGVIRHQALSAMEEQTDLQMNQIREQIELLVKQAQQINKRKELAHLIYNAKLNFRPLIGQVYHLYQKKDESYLLSMISPEEWGGGSGPYKQFVTSARLLADHTWIEV
jgi:hypothetical protein